MLYNNLFEEMQNFALFANQTFVKKIRVEIKE